MMKRFSAKRRSYRTYYRQITKRHRQAIGRRARFSITKRKKTSV